MVKFTPRGVFLFGIANPKQQKILPKLFFNGSIIKKMCLSLYRKIQEIKGLKGKKSKRRIRKCMGWTYEEEMKQALILFDPTTLRKCLEKMSSHRT